MNHNTWCASVIRKWPGTEMCGPCDCNGEATTREEQRLLYNKRNVETKNAYGPFAPFIAPNRRPG